VELAGLPTRICSLGRRYSPSDALVGTIDRPQRNCLGRGWEAAIRIRAGASSQQGTVSFTEPWLFDRPLAAGFDIYKSIRQYTEYNYDTTGLNLRMSHPFEEFWRWQVGYRVSRDDITKISDNASPDLKSQEGVSVTSAIGAELTRDSRDLVAPPP